MKETWVCDLCKALNEERYAFCTACFVGERRVSYANQRPLRTVKGSR